MELVLFPLTAILTPDNTAGKTKRRVIQGLSNLRDLLRINFTDAVLHAVELRMKLRSLHRTTIE
jgi:hypothetical protein